MKLTKGKLSKLYNKKKQSCKEKKYLRTNKNVKKSTFRNKSNLNLSSKTLKNIFPSNMKGGSHGLAKYRNYYGGQPENVVAAEVKQEKLQQAENAGVLPPAVVAAEEKQEKLQQAENTGVSPPAEVAAEVKQENLQQAENTGVSPPAASDVQTYDSTDVVNSIKEEETNDSSQETPLAPGSAEQPQLGPDGELVAPDSADKQQQDYNNDEYSDNEEYNENEDNEEEQEQGQGQRQDPNQTQQPQQPQQPQSNLPVDVANSVDTLVDYIASKVAQKVSGTQGQQDGYAAVGEQSTATGGKKRTRRFRTNPKNVTR